MDTLSLCSTKNKMTDVSPALSFLIFVSFLWFFFPQERNNRLKKSRDLSASHTDLAHWLVGWPCHISRMTSQRSWASSSCLLASDSCITPPRAHCTGFNVSLHFWRFCSLRGQFCGVLFLLINTYRGTRGSYVWCVCNCILPSVSLCTCLYCTVLVHSLVFSFSLWGWSIESSSPSTVNSAQWMFRLFCLTEKYLCCKLRNSHTSCWQSVKT